MAGYKGWSMSWNAVEAYENGEKPISKWSKREIIEEVLWLNDKLDAGILNKCSTSFLKSFFLKRTSWHHTSKFYNATNFYAIDEEFVEKLDNEWLVKSANFNLIGGEKGKVLKGIKKTAYIFTSKRIWFWISKDCKDYIDVWNWIKVEGFEVNGKDFFFKREDNKWDVAFFRKRQMSLHDYCKRLTKRFRD